MKKIKLFTFVAATLIIHVALAQKDDPKATEF